MQQVHQTLQQGAHRLKIELTLTSLAESSTSDTSFVEIVRVKNGIVQYEARFTEYSILGETLAEEHLMSLVIIQLDLFSLI